MARIFGALANALGQYEGGRFKRKQYDDQQAQQTLENQRRAFEFAATNGRLEEQMRLMQQQREDALQRQREMDVVGAQQKGYETAAPEAAASAANAFMQSQGMGGPGGVVKAKGTPVAQYEAEGMKFGDPSLTPREVQYASVGGRLMRYDPQREVNEQTSQAFQKYMASLSEKKMLQGQRAQDREDQIRLTRRLIPPPQPRAPRTQLVQNQDGEYVIVDMDQAGPTGLTGPKKAAAGGAKVSATDRKRLLDVQDIMRSAVDARQATEGVEGFAGPIDVPLQRAKTMLGRPDAKITNAMRAYQRLASPAARATIGTAMTPQEIKRLDKWLPMLESSDESVIRQGIAGFEKEAKAIWQENLDVMRASGIDVSEFEGLPKKWDASGTANETPAQRLARMRGKQ